MPDDYAGLYGFDAAASAEVREKIARQFLAENALPVVARSPLDDLLGAIAEAAEEQTFLVATLVDRLGNAGVLMPSEEGAALPIPKALTFPLGVRLQAHVCYLVGQNRNLRILLELLAL